MVCGRLCIFSIFSVFERDDIVVCLCSVVVFCWVCILLFVFLFVEFLVNFFVSYFVVFYVRWDSVKFRYLVRFLVRMNGKKLGGVLLCNIYFFVFVLLFLCVIEMSDFKS